MSEKLKIGMNARPFVSSSLRGIARHTLELIRNLHSEYPEIEFFLYTYGKVDSFYKDQLPYVNWRETKISPKLLWDLWYLPSQISKDGIDLFHSTNNLGLPFSNIKKIATIHDDLTHRHRVKGGLEQLWGKLNYFLEYYLLKQADLFITISHAAKKDIIKTLKLPENNIRVIYNGVSKHIVNISIEKADYYLYVGGLEERKNISFLISELESVQFKLKRQIQLKCISKLNSASPALQEKIRQSKLSIQICEDVSDGDLFTFYQQTKAVIIPSLVEGFGIPLIEAMQMRAPLIVSDIEVFKEVTDQKAYFFDPRKSGDLSKLISKIENDELALNKFIEDGLIVARRYDWSKMAKDTLKIYKEVLI